MRVVLDTNVLVSAFLFEQRLGSIVRLIQQGAITPCFIVATFRELEAVLWYKKFAPLFASAHTSIDEILEDLQGKSVILDDPKVVARITTDRPDNYVLAAAKLANAACIVTGDKLLLAVRQFDKIPVITPKKFLRDWVR